VAGVGGRRLLPGASAVELLRVGKIGRDQVEDYARRSGMTLSEAEKWLAPNLSYEPQAAPLGAPL